MFSGKCKWMLLLAVVLAAVLKVAEAQDYCDPDLCDPGQTHIGCNNPGGFVKGCNEPKVVPVTDELKKIMLDEHNKYRSTVATGGVKWLPKAKRMTTVVWDDELAKLAQLNANRCVQKHDDCHNTANHRYSGQNLNHIATTASSIDNVPQVIKDLISSWWDERYDVNSRMVKSMYDPGRHTMIFHFAVLAADKSNKIGCAVSQWTDNGTWLYLVCNYSFTDVVGLPMYASGEPCSGCTTGCNSAYAGLCNPDEPVSVPF
ncbi:antigen 5 like allergen Cul n 1-like [Anopheles cruzii]|uniref:antigen 5 like allergen Cul n 1-like n=1 Tax=Anopheles cruzii TaxID=68878 RepID=UPI0022EC64E1|nr:antigen 5 like allergen Cul n 1-like [Anopheles cruzii]